MRNPHQITSNILCYITMNIHVGHTFVANVLNWLFLQLPYCVGHFTATIFMANIRNLTFLWLMYYVGCIHSILAKTRWLEM